MEYWPSYSQPLDSAVTTKPRQRSKASAKRINYSTLDHGAFGAASLVEENGKLAWTTTVSREQGKLNFVGKPVKCYPYTKPIHTSAGNVNLQERSSEGVKFLRTTYPDIDIPFSIVKEHLSECDDLEKQLEVWDAMKGNTLSVSYISTGSGRNIMALAHASGPLDSDLKVSPFTIKQGRVVFQPRAETTWASNTPICQIESSTSDPSFAENKASYVGIRSYGKVSIFNLKSDMTSLSGGHSPFKLDDVMHIRPSELDNGGAGHIADMSFVTARLPNIFITTNRGCVFVASGGEEKTLLRVCSAQEEISQLWRVYGHNSLSTGLLLSDKSVRLFDMRDPTARSSLFDMMGRAHLLTSLASSRVEHLITVTSTDQVIWLDHRFPKRPLLGWKHHRAYDRTLRTDCVGIDDTSVTILTSAKNNHASTICAGRLDKGPFQCRMRALALPSPSSEVQMMSSVIVKNPDVTDSFCLMQLSDRGSLHQSEFHYNSGRQGTQSVQRFHFKWSDEVFKLEKQSVYLENDDGNTAAGEQQKADMRALYQELFSVEALKARTENEENEKERVYDILDKLPTYWQRSDHEEALIKTMLDVATEMDEEIVRDAKSLFLSENVLESARGFHALTQGRFASALEQIAKAAPLHIDLRRTMKKIDSTVFQQGSSSEALEPYLIDDELDTIAYKLHTHNVIDLDLTMSSDIFSFEPIRPRRNERRQSQIVVHDLEEELSRATDNLKLTQSEPPQVTFSYFNPMWQEAKRTRERSMEVDSDVGSGDDNHEQVAEMPMGIRLLLTDWELGADPQAYHYVDPYGVDESEPSQAVARGSRSQHFGSSSQRLEPVIQSIPSRQTQLQAPTDIVASRSQQSQRPPTIGLSRTLTQTQTQMFGSHSQSQTEPGSSQLPMASTQVLPGPFGGRPGQTKKKLIKKRQGGF